MYKTKASLRVLLSLALAGLCQAQEPQNQIWERQSLTDGFWGLNDSLSDNGMLCRKDW